ncbi:MAG: ribose-phosphate pyrophosphokinase-like domain-containing protein, partial [Bacteroidetes bacterium]|nr:ribose-phosphate pyrophosphokinase-like domain-containing protein [Bacteroidota bacterium]
MQLKIFSGRSNEPLAQEIVDYLVAKHGEYFEQHGQEAIKLGSLDAKRGFSDGELYDRYKENLRGCDVFIVQPTNQPHENDEELRIMVDTA